MARTIKEIYEDYINTNNLYPELAVIPNTNTSDMSLLQTLYYIASIEDQLQQQYYDAFKTDLEIIAGNATVGTSKWWQNRMLTYYQYSTDPDYGVLKAIAPFYIPKYDLIDNNLNIVKYCSVSQTNRQVTIKVSKQVDNSPSQLNNDELLSVKKFVDDSQTAGLLINCVSFPADLLKLDIEVYYNSGYIESIVLQQVKDAITNYTKTLNFDGAIYLSKIADNIQNIQGVNDVKINNAYGRAEANAYEIFDRRYITTSGYINLDIPNSTFTLINSL
jgi:hypothetical protein